MTFFSQDLTSWYENHVVGTCYHKHRKWNVGNLTSLWKMTIASLRRHGTIADIAIPLQFNVNISEVGGRNGNEFIKVYFVYFKNRECVPLDRRRRRVRIIIVVQVSGPSRFSNNLTKINMWCTVRPLIHTARTINVLRITLHTSI